MRIFMRMEATDTHLRHDEVWARFEQNYGFLDIF